MGTYPPAISMPYYELDVTFNNSGGTTTVYVQGGPNDVPSLATAVSDAISGLDTVASVTSNLWSEAELDHSRSRQAGITGDTRLRVESDGN